MRRKIGAALFFGCACAQPRQINPFGQCSPVGKAQRWVPISRRLQLAVKAAHSALPTGEHCPKGLICLGCAHAQPKKSAVPIFRRMLASHERSLVAARGHSEPAGQIAAREMEIVRIKGALQRAEELSDDVAAAIERAL